MDYRPLRNRLDICHPARMVAALSLIFSFSGLRPAHSGSPALSTVTPFAFDTSKNVLRWIHLVSQLACGHGALLRPNTHLLRLQDSLSHETVTDFFPDALICLALPDLHRAREVRMRIG